MNKQQFEQQFEAISDQIWDFAETRYQEYRSSALQAFFRLIVLTLLMV